MRHLQSNSFDDLARITQDTACVIAETVQAESGILPPQNGWLKALQQRCNEVGALFILDEIQAGFGRTGKLWGFEHFDVVPDVVLLGKALGGGMPLGAFVADKKMMDVFTDNPVLGHITTFGGHPVCCAAGKAAFEVLLEEQLYKQAAQKETLFKSLVIHPGILSVSSFGMWMAIAFADFETCKRIVDRCIAKGVFTDWFLFASNCLRISPPLTISEEEIRKAAAVIIDSID